MKIIDHVLARIIDKVTAYLGSFWPPTGTIYDSDSWKDAYRSRKSDDTQNGQ